MLIANFLIIRSYRMFGKDILSVHDSWLEAGMKISDISVDIFPIYPISVMFDTISAMIDISPIYRFWTDILWKHQVCSICTR